MVAGHLRIKRGVYQIVINYVDSDGHKRQKSMSTGLKIKGNKKRAQEMLEEVISELSKNTAKDTPDSITSKVATMACKASVKGGMSMNFKEIEALLDELLLLDNPYHCPHGRPTIFTMSKYELEKKFKRIV